MLSSYSPKSKGYPIEVDPEIGMKCKESSTIATSILIKSKQNPVEIEPPKKGQTLTKTMVQKWQSPFKTPLGSCKLVDRTRRAILTHLGALTAWIAYGIF